MHIAARLGQAGVIIIVTVVVLYTSASGTSTGAPARSIASDDTKNPNEESANSSRRPRSLNYPCVRFAPHD